MRCIHGPLETLDSSRNLRNDDAADFVPTFGRCGDPRLETQRGWPR